MKFFDEHAKPVGSAEMKELDRKTISKAGIPSMVLMERAALVCYKELIAGDFDLKRTICICGTGNNGGDGIAVARLLRLGGFDASVLLVGDDKHCSKDTKKQISIAEHYKVPILHLMPDDKASLKLPVFTTIVDAIFGIGLKRPVEGRLLELVNIINKKRNKGAKVLSVDIPSGISADTGQVLGVAVNADATVTFARNKIGLCISPGKEYCGKLKIADIGIY